MATLHLVNRSPAESRALECCLARVGKGDAVLLIEDAVYAARKGAATAPSGQGAAFYVLGPDLEARGVEFSEIAEPVRIVDYGGFVELTVEYRLVQSWF
ncbi:sulfurtransferase complex subunit TusB [Methylocaldum sp. MU1018]